MPNTRDLERRIRSVKGTQQITKAMKMVAAAKLQRSQGHMLAARPYSSKLADLLGLSVWRPDLNFEGGNLTSDGAGTCFASRAHQLHNLPLLPYEVDEILWDYFGCEKTIWFETLDGEGTGHHDMFSKMLTPTTWIMGEYTAAQDADNDGVSNLAEYQAGTDPQTAPPPPSSPPTKAGGGGGSVDPGQLGQLCRLGHCAHVDLLAEGDDVAVGQNLFIVDAVGFHTVAFRLDHDFNILCDAGVFLLGKHGFQHDDVFGFHIQQPLGCLAHF